MCQFTNLITGSHLRVGDGLESCTTKVQVSIPFELDGQLVELIDTPGFDDATTSDADVLNMVANYLCATSVTKLKPHIHTYRYHVSTATGRERNWRV